MQDNFQVPPIQKPTDETVKVAPIQDNTLPSFVKVSTLQPDLKNKGRIGLYLAIGAVIFLIFSFLLIGALGATQTTGNIGIIVSLFSLIPLGLGGTIAVRGFITFKAQPPQVVNIEAKIIRIEKILNDRQQLQFIPVLSYVFQNHIIENPCLELAHTAPDYQINTSVIIPIDAKNPNIFWINSKPQPKIPTSIYSGLAIFCGGLIMLLLPLFF